LTANRKKTNGGNPNGTSAEDFAPGQKTAGRGATSTVRRKNADSGAHKRHGVFLAVDRPLLRECLALVLKQEGFEIVGHAACREEAFAHPSLTLAKVVLLDLVPGNGDAFGVIKGLFKQGLRSVVCSMRADSTSIRAVFAAGASAYVTQEDEPKHLFEAIHAASASRSYVSPRAGAALARKISGLENPVSGEELSRQQWQIYQRLAQGESAEEIAARMHVSPRTVESYCYRMIEKLDLAGMKDLRRHAIASLNGASA